MDSVNNSGCLRTDLLTEQAIFVDGMAGCGKTMLSPIISSLERVELMTYAFEIQYYCTMHFLGELHINGAKTLVQCQADLQLYNTMMSRQVNFRPSDLSSVQNDVEPTRYYQRLYAPGDEVIPDRIRKERPVMNFCVHHLIPFAKPIAEGLGKKAFFIDVVRHPLYMIKQQALNFERLIPTPRDINIYLDWNGKKLPYYFKGWEEKYVNSSSPYEQAIHYCDNISKRTKENEGCLPNLLRIPFEPFVLNPSEYMQKVHNYLGLGPGKHTKKKLIDSNVPREKVAQSIDLEIYRRCGWTPAKEGMSERDELNLRYEYFCKEIGTEARDILDRLIEDYENNYWKP